MTSTKKMTREFIKEIKDLGVTDFTVTNTKSGHKKFVLFKGKHKTIVLLAATPSCRRALTNTVADVKRWLQSLT